jgi:hypothetical protein
VIEAYGYRWYRVGGLDYLLRRSDIDIPAMASHGKRQTMSALLGSQESKAPII